MDIVLPRLRGKENRRVYLVIDPVRVYRSLLLRSGVELWWIRWPCLNFGRPKSEGDC